MRAHGRDRVSGRALCETLHAPSLFGLEDVAGAVRAYQMAGLNVPNDKQPGNLTCVLAARSLPNDAADHRRALCIVDAVGSGLINIRSASLPHLVRRKFVNP
ncbi:hypothetical protein SAMN00790413_03420 [Deinococcus hopiensis KR-140]|uniref:Uncharacterized protein n=1 Tax=Deinococcus hopiensis KR-140 TaxID=695939 RepID=A0A1W1UWL9_9DEIO|nr:hypothetical protein SAMN00790413_03420 [Deinococcus hopiensis KR-140]